MKNWCHAIKSMIMYKHARARTHTHTHRYAHTHACARAHTHVSVMPVNAYLLTCGLRACSPRAFNPWARSLWVQNSLASSSWARSPQTGVLTIVTTITINILLIIVGLANCKHKKSRFASSVAYLSTITLLAGFVTCFSAISLVATTDFWFMHIAERETLIAHSIYI